MNPNTSKPYNPQQIDPNKIKKCNCENKTDPKPFSNNVQSNQKTN